MADLSKAKKPIHAHWPERVIESAPGIDRFEKLLTPKTLKKRFFFGIPMTSPLTGENLTETDMKDAIVRAVNILETDTRTEVMPTIKRHRLPFDAQLYSRFIHLEIPHKPIQKVISVKIASSSYSMTDPANQAARYPDGSVLYTIPNEWIDMANANRGILNVNPFSPAFTAVGVATTPSASPLTAFLGQLSGVPGFWNVEVLCGLGGEDGSVPVFVNEAIGTKAAMLLLDNLIPLYRIASQSLGADGLSQSVNDLGYQLLKQKRDDLEVKYKEYVKTLKSLTGNTMFVSNV
jgi:hypothetical protein